jgi:hypothetical protein
MTWAEVKHFALAAVKAAPASEYLAAGKPADEHKLVWLWDAEVFAIHLFHADLEVVWQALCDWMGWVDNPHALDVIGFAPAQ